MSENRPQMLEYLTPAMPRRRRWTPFVLGALAAFASVVVVLAVLFTARSLAQRRAEQAALQAQRAAQQAAQPARVNAATQP